MRGRFERMIRGVQAKVVAAVQEVDGKEFRQDAWTRPAGGGGITRVLQEGNVWEKAGVAVSVVYGSMSAEAYRVAVGKDIPYGKVRGLGWAALPGSCGLGGAGLGRQAIGSGGRRVFACSSRASFGSTLTAPARLPAGCHCRMTACPSSLPASAR